MTLFAGLTYRETPQMFLGRGKVTGATRVSNLSGKYQTDAVSDVVSVLETIATCPFPCRMPRHIITMYDLPEVLLLCDEKLSRNPSDKLCKKRSAVLLMLVSSAAGTENSSSPSCLLLSSAVPNLSLFRPQSSSFPASQLHFKVLLEALHRNI